MSDMPTDGLTPGSRFGEGTQRVGFFGQPPVEPAARADYAMTHDRGEPDAPLFSIKTYPSVPDKVFVELPHQCDEWVVASGTKDEAIAELNAFLAAGVVALSQLMNDEIEQL